MTRGRPNGPRGWRLCCKTFWTIPSYSNRRDEMDEQTRIQAEAAAFRRLQKHLMEDRKDVQNIDMMNLAGFCRNCLSRWYQEAANDLGVAMDKAQGREAFYGMPYAEWKD